MRIESLYLLWFAMEIQCLYLLLFAMENECTFFFCLLFTYLLLFAMESKCTYCCLPRKVTVLTVVCHGNAMFELIVVFPWKGRQSLYLLWFAMNKAMFVLTVVCHEKSMFVFAVVCH